MLSRSSKGAAELLSCQNRPVCRKCLQTPALRRRDVFARSQSTASDENDLSYRPFTKRHKKFENLRRRRETVDSSKMPIGFAMLGEPGEVVVVKDRRKRRELRQAESTPEEDAENTTLPFMLDEVENSEDYVEDAVLKKRIESLRLSHQPGDKLAATDFNNLRKAVQSSFTVIQLSSYISGFRANQSAPVDMENKKAKWIPGTSAFLERSSGSSMGVGDRIVMSQSLKGKRAIAEKILRDCWHLGIFEEVGQIDIFLPPHSLSLLLSSDHFSFEELASIYGAKIDVTHSLGLLRITGKETACTSIREIVSDATQRKRSEAVELFSPGDARAQASIFTPEFLSWVEGTYGIDVGLTVSKKIRDISYLVENKQDADNARRALNLAVYDATSSSSSIPFGTYLSASEPIGSYDVVAENSTSWFDRQKSWFRWAVPSTQSAETKTLETPFFDKHDTRLSAELLKLLRHKAPFDFSKHENTAEVHESVTAAVGKCLFQRKPFSEDKTFSPTELGKLNLPRTFTTDVPRAALLLRQLEPSFPRETMRPHRISLVPSTIHTNVFPRLDLEYSVQDSTLSDTTTPEVVLRSAKAILIENNVDYLLPENGLDLRFTRKVTREISKLNEGQFLQPLQKTLQELFAKSAKNKTEEALPPFAQISLPNELLSNTNEKLDPTGFTTAEYIFQSVNDIQGTRVDRYDFRGQQLNYSFYESGPYKAHRTTDMFLDIDLTEDAKRLAETSDSSVSSEEASPTNGFTSFYSNACAMAFELDKTWRMV